MDIGSYSIYIVCVIIYTCPMSILGAPSTFTTGTDQTIIAAPLENINISQINGRDFPSSYQPVMRTYTYTPVTVASGAGEQTMTIVSDESSTYLKSDPSTTTGELTQPAPTQVQINVSALYRFTYEMFFSADTLPAPGDFIQCNAYLYVINGGTTVALNALDKIFTTGLVANTMCHGTVDLYLESGNRIEIRTAAGGVFAGNVEIGGALPPTNMSWLKITRLRLDA